MSENLPGSRKFLQSRKDKFNVFAGSEFIRGIVRTGAMVVARPAPPDLHAIDALREGVTNTELGKERLRPDILKFEVLLATELAAKSPLPFDRRKIRRRKSSGQFGLF